MGRFAVLVDAGYLLSQAVQILSDQRSKSRKDLAITNPQGLITMIAGHAAAALGNTDLLRVYWYDGVHGRLSAEHEALSLLPDLQFRAGTISKSGQQKGVDSRIMADLIELSGHRAIVDAALVTGDGDLVVGIDLAQRHGVRVAVLGLEDASQGLSHNQSFEVVCVADRVRRMSRTDIAPYCAFLSTSAETGSQPVSKAKAVVPSSPKKAVAKKATAKKQPMAAKAPEQVPKSPAPAASAPASKPDLQELPALVKIIIAGASPPFDQSAVSSTGALGQATDSKLLKAATELLGRKPMPSERTALRRLFRESLTK